jgi:hypothetical protein
MILYKNRIKQVLDFSGVGNSKIHPSDIDAVLEFDNKFLILFEVKLKGVKVPFGQRLLFQRIADAWQSVNKEAFVVYCEHQTNVKEIVSMENTTVVNVYHRGRDTKRNEVIKEFLYKLAEHYGIDKLKKSL